jgi:hypothetical protein
MPEIPPNPPLMKGGGGGISGWRVVPGKAYHFGCGSAALCPLGSLRSIVILSLSRIEMILPLTPLRMKTLRSAQRRQRAQRSFPENHFRLFALSFEMALEMKQSLSGTLVSNPLAILCSALSAVNYFAHERRSEILGNGRGLILHT